MNYVPFWFWLVSFVAGFILGIIIGRLSKGEKMK